MKATTCRLGRCAILAAIPVLLVATGCQNLTAASDENGEAAREASAPSVMRVSPAIGDREAEEATPLAARSCGEDEHRGELPVVDSWVVVRVTIHRDEFNGGEWEKIDYMSADESWGLLRDAIRCSTLEEAQRLRDDAAQLSSSIVPKYIGYGIQGLV